MNDLRYLDGGLFVVVACVLGAMGFAWQGWNPVLGLLAGGLPVSILWAVVIAADDEDKRG